MPKDYFKGVASENKSVSSQEAERSIRNIPINTRRERPPLASATPTGIAFPHDAIGGTPSPRGTFSFVFSFVRRFALWVIALLTLVFLGIAVAAVFRDTSVEVTPRTHPIVIAEDISLTAYPEESEQALLGGLTYTNVIRNYEAEQTVPTSGYTEVADYASGTITLYNEYGAKPIRLIKNSRFQSTDGLIFRIRESIIIPGKRGDSPGTISATVYADQPGEKYNIATPNKFTIPGLAGSDMAKSVYARSSQSVTGGFLGAKPKVAEADVVAARDKLRSALEEKARVESLVTASSGNVVFSQLLLLTFETPSITRGADGQAVVRERLVATLPLFAETLFARVLASATRADAGKASVRIEDFSALSVRKAATQDVSQGTIDLLISGSALLEWEVDVEALGRALAGAPKASFENIISGYEGIEKAHAAVRPMWRKTFPADPASIQITIKKGGVE